MSKNGLKWDHVSNCKSFDDYTWKILLSFMNKCVKIILFVELLHMEIPDILEMQAT